MAEKYVIFDKMTIFSKKGAALFCDKQIFSYQETLLMRKSDLGGGHWENEHFSEGVFSPPLPLTFITFRRRA